MRGGVAVVVVGFSVLLTICPASARTWYILSDGTGNAPTIQAGIDSASAGDTVSVGCGTYYEHSIVMKSGVRLEGEPGDPSCVVIDAQQLGRVLYCDGVDSTTEFEGMTITGGLAGWGGGMYCINGASPRLNNLVFLRNHSGYGGGLSCTMGYSVVLRNVVFEENSCGSWGGGVRSDGEFGEGSIELSNCLFVGNTAKGGAGMSCIYECNVRLDNVIFEDNVASGGGTDYGGGGLYVSEWSVATITGCTFRRNSCNSYGGGMYTYSFCENRIENCLFSENVAGQLGGGICCSEDSSATKNCTFDRNRAGVAGGGISSIWWPSPAIDSCTFFMNEAPLGSGIASLYFSHPWLVRSIVAYGVEGEAIFLESEFGCTIDIRCSDLYGNAGGDWVGDIAAQYGIDGNFSACPSFCNAPGGDFRLCDESPCLPGNHPDSYDCGLIGAWGEGCSCGPTQTVPTTWGAIKSMYK